MGIPASTPRQGFGNQKAPTQNGILIINIQICLGGRGFVLVMVEGTPLVFVATVAVNEDVATQRVFVLYTLTVRAGQMHQQKSEMTDLGPLISENRPDGGGHSRGSASRPWWGFGQIKDRETAP